MLFFAAVFAAVEVFVELVEVFVELVDVFSCVDPEDTADFSAVDPVEAGVFARLLLVDATLLYDDGVTPILRSVCV